MKRIAIVVGLALVASLVTALPAQARSCPPPTVGGKTIATITVGSKVVPVKSVTYKKGQALVPPATNQAAGLSRRNQPFGAKRGNTIVTWHVRYGVGCPGALNALTTLPIGTQFTVKPGKKKPVLTYQILRRESVKKGGHKRSWFKQTGKPRLVLLTCADFDGKNTFRKTMAIFAAPVKKPATPPATTTPTTTPGTSS